MSNAQRQCRSPGALRCPAKAVKRQDIEDIVWQDCARFARNPGEALEEVRRQLRERLARSEELEGERRRLRQALAENEAARERVMTLYRRGRATLAETERQLDEARREGDELRAQLEALRGEQDLAEAFEAHYTGAAALLAELAAQVDDVERTGDWDTKRRVIEHLVIGIRLETRGRGNSRLALARITYAFSPEHVVEFTTGSH